MDTIEIIGLVAALLSTSAFLPQTLKTIKSKNTRDLSLPMYIMLVSGVSLWLVYGILRGSIAIIIANAVTLVLSSIILGMIILYKDY